MVRNVKPLEKSAIKAAYVFSGGEVLSKARAMMAQLEVLVIGQVQANYRH